VKIGFSIAISALFLGLAVRGVDWAEAGRALAGANYFWVLPIIGATLWSLYVRAQRWQVLLRPIASPSMRTLITATNIGFMANMLLPLRAGEIIRPVLVSRREGEPLGGILATIVLERIFDMFTILFLFGLSATLVPVSEEVSRWGGRLFGLAIAIGLVVVMIRWQHARALSLLATLTRPLPAKVRDPLISFAEGFVQALEILGRPMDFLRLLGWSLYLWLVIASIYLFGLLCFGIEAPLVMGAIVITAVVAIAVSAPSAPGYIGAFQIGCTLALAIFGVAESDAFAY
jgi:hypothetical protein